MRSVTVLVRVALWHRLKLHDWHRWCLLRVISVTLLVARRAGSTWTVGRRWLSVLVCANRATKVLVRELVGKSVVNVGSVTAV